MIENTLNCDIFTQPELKVGGTFKDKYFVKNVSKMFQSSRHTWAPGICDRWKPKNNKNLNEDLCKKNYFKHETIFWPSKYFKTCYSRL